MFFAHERQVINFTSFGGKDLEDNARVIVRDGLLSALSSIYHHLNPTSFLSDERGTIVFLLTLFDGHMFESYYDPATDEDIVKPIDYAKWQTQHAVQMDCTEVPAPNGKTVPWAHVLYWFSPWFCVEVVRWSFFSEYLTQIEDSFASLTEDQIGLLGKSWAPENFPKGVLPPPKF